MSMRWGMWFRTHRVILAALGALSLFDGGAQAASPPQGGDVDAKSVQYTMGSLAVDAYIAAPPGAGMHPAVIVIHGSTGLNDPIKEIVRRFATAGFVAMAPSLSAQPAVPAGMGMQTPEDAGTPAAQLPQDRSVDILKEGYAFLSKYPGVDSSRISSVGFDWGGWRSFMLAESIPSLYRAIVYCGRTPADGLQNVQTPILAHYAQFDFRITGNSVLTEEKMKQLGKQFTDYVYPNTQAAFFNEKSPQYNAEAAKLAWNRTLQFLGASQ